MAYTFTTPTTTPYLTSQDIINSVQRKISFPLSQQTFTMLDILAFANEETYISQVPSILQFHSEYFVTYVSIPLLTNVSNYSIPSRSIGQKLRSVFWQDPSGNMFEMTQVAEEDRAFYQRNIGTNQAIHKFFIEGNSIVLTPGLIVNPTGNLIFVFYLRPNQLVKNDRAAVINNFFQSITLNNSLINPLDVVTIGVDANPAGPGVNNIPFTAVNGYITGNTVANPTVVNTYLPHGLITGQQVLIIGSNSVPSLNGLQTVTVIDANDFSIPVNVTVAGTTGTFSTNIISSITFNSTTSTLITTAVPNNLSQFETITISGSNSNPSIDGTYQVTPTSPTTFTIPIEIATPGTSGTFFSPNQFVIAPTGTLTAANLATSINALNMDTTANALANVVVVSYPNIYEILSCPNTTGFIIPSTYSTVNQTTNATIGINFQSLPTTYTDQETNVTSSLFTPGAIIDFLQTNPGHKTYKYDVQIPQNAISGTNLIIPQSSLLIPTGTVNTIPAVGIQYMIAPLIPGDYICLANECIIPQIPPDLHNGLAERTSARILAALGDQAGLQASNAKIQEIEQRQGNLMSTRDDGNVQKVTGRHSLLHQGMLGRFRRM